MEQGNKLSVIFLILIFLYSIKMSSTEISEKERLLIKNLITNINSLDTSMLIKNFYFPLINENIKYVIDTKTDTVSIELFEQNIEKIFPKKFRETLNKINFKNEELKFIEDKGKCNLNTLEIYKNNENQIIIDWTIHEIVFANTEDEDCSEYAFVFVFKMINNQLVFENFLIAG